MVLLYAILGYVLIAESVFLLFSFDDSSNSWTRIYIINIYISLFKMVKLCWHFSSHINGLEKYM